MTRYSCTATNTSNTTINTEDTFLEISVNNPKIFMVRVRLGDGTATAGVDNDWRVRLVRKTAGGATGTGGTAVRLDQIEQTSGATVTIKNGTAAFTTATLGDIIDMAVKNGRETYEWIARDDESFIKVHPTLGSGGMFAVLIQSAAVSQKFTVSAFWEE